LPPRSLALAGCLALLQAGDLALTYLLLGGGHRPDVYEANPLAAALLARHGWAGLGTLKLVCSLAAATAALLVCRRHAAAGARLLVGLCLVMAGVVGYSGTLLARPPAVPTEVSAALERGSRLDDRVARVQRLDARRADICLAALEGRHDLAEGVEQMRACLGAYGPALTTRVRAMLPDLEEPGEVAAYLYHHASRLVHDYPGLRGGLRRLAAEVAWRYPGSPIIDAPPQGLPAVPSWRLARERGQPAGRLGQG
jgi:hypothetical protein